MFLSFSQLDLGLGRVFMFSITLVHIGLGRVFTKRSSGAMVPPKDKKKKDLWESDLSLMWG